MSLIACRSTPLPHQLMLANLYAEREAFAYFNEQGTGKSWQAINDFSVAYFNARVNALVVIGPSGVERNWMVKELPAHMDVALLANSHILMWNTQKAHTQAADKERKRFLEPHHGPAILLMSYSAATTALGKKFLKAVLTKFRCFYVLDESQFVKNPGSKRTMTIVASGNYAKHKRIMTGTPMGANGPLDVYAQVKFLDDMFWKNRGIKDFQVFKAFFADWLPMDGWSKCLGYKNLSLLNEWLKDISCRVLKRDVLKDLPERTYTRNYFDLPKEHRRVYNQLRDDLRTRLQSGETVEVLNTLVLRSKFMQICCGYIAVDKGEPFELIDGNLPRIESVQEWLEASNSQAIIWTRFRMDVDQYVKVLGEKNVARYDGKLNPEQRALELEAFQRGDKPYFVCNPQVGGTGLTINEADRANVHAMRDDPIELKQALDRNHRPGQHKPVGYCFTAATDTVDEKIIDTHVKNNEISCEVLGDKVLDFI